MNEIICPGCKKAFKIDEAGFADILKQVRTQEFERELHERAELFEKDKQSAVQLAAANTKNELQAELAKSAAEIAELRATKDAEVTELKSERATLIAELKAEKDAEIGSTSSVCRHRKAAGRYRGRQQSREGTRRAK
jgi:hypothetical protein